MNINIEWILHDQCTTILTSTDVQNHPNQVNVITVSCMIFGDNNNNINGNNKYYEAQWLAFIFNKDMGNDKKCSFPYFTEPS